MFSIANQGIGMLGKIRREEKTHSTAIEMREIQ